MKSIEIRDIPTSAKEVKRLGWEQLDVILFTGDAYVDHPSFGIAVVARILLKEGYKVAVVPQPNWRDDLRDFKKLGTPRLFFGVSSGNMDSMVNHYTAAKRLRSDDAYTSGGKAGARPDYATSVYSKILKELYPSVPVIIGGIEASLRRVTHYDYWQDKLLPSILEDSKADILCYGMGDRAMVDIARTFHNGFNLKRLRRIRQVAFIAPKDFIKDTDPDTIILNSFEQCKKSKKAFGENWVHIERESNMMEPKRLVEPIGDRVVVVNPPLPYLSQEEIDATYDLPFTRLPHPRYRGKGDISAFHMIKFSVNMHRGCFGGCSFCTISAHQGKFISSRSEGSILKEIEQISKMEDFKGVLSDIGGPSANMYRMAGKNQELCQKCKRPSCIFPKVCKNLDNDHAPLTKLYRRIDSLPYIKHAFIGSGIRYDMIDEGSYRTYLEQVITRHTSGRLKVAPEHTQDQVLSLMRKPTFDLFDRLNSHFKGVCQKHNLRYQLIPYFISSHPGCDMEQMKKLSQRMRPLGYTLEQVQDFTPTPMTLSSVIYYTGEDPYSGQKVFVERDMGRKREQKSFFFRR